MLNLSQIDARITHNPEVLGGKPIIKGTRMPVDLIVDFAKNGVSVDQIVEDYPEPTRQDAAGCRGRPRLRQAGGSADRSPYLVVRA